MSIQKKSAARLFGALIAGLLLAAAGGCLTDSGEEQDSSSGEESEKEQNRFTFLRPEEAKELRTEREALEQEEVVQTPLPPGELTPERLKRLEAQKNTGQSGGSNPPSARKRPDPFYEEFILLDADEKLPVSLVFNSAPLLDVLPAFADVLGFNFVADPELKGTITINLNSTMSRRELWNTFDKVLSLSGAGAVVNESLLRIVPLSKLAQQPDLAVSREEEAEVYYYPLKNATAKDVVTQIKPFLGKDSVCVELTRPNAVVVSDDRANIPKIRQLLDIIDRNGKGNWPRAVIRCHNILPSKITDELKNVMPVLGFNVLQVTDKTEQPGSIQLSAIDRLQLIVASAATEEAVTEIRNWVEILDSSDSLDQERVFVYRVMHGKADQLLNALAVIYNTQGSSLTIDESTGNERTETISNTPSANRRSSTSASNSPNAATRTNTVNSAANTETDQTSSIFEKEVRIFADGVLNRLVIRTNPRTYASIKALLDRLDIVPAQVLLQVLVVEVTLTESTQFGLELSGAAKAGGDNLVFGNNYSNLNPDLTGNPVGATKEDGLSFLLSDRDNPQNKFGYIRALAGNGLVKVVACPQVLVSSHTEAELKVVEDVPYVASALTDTASTSSTSTAFTSQIDYQEAGVILTITPQITSTDLISLDITQTLSSVLTNSYTTVDAPVFPTREITTNMTIRNGRTMIIGGLIQEKKTDNLSSVPIINSIPFLRRLFGSTDASVERSEILVLITGYIIDEQSKVEEMIKRYNDAVKALNDFDDNLGDRPGAGKRVTLYEKISQSGI